MNSLIEKRATGNPQEFSKKMNFSKRSLMGYLQVMKTLGFPVKYDRGRGSYFYKETCDISNVPGVLIDKKEQKKINAQMSSEEREKCAAALRENNEAKITVHCGDLFIG